MNTLSEDDFRSIAALWEHRPERLAQVTDQVRQIAAKLADWGMATTTREELDCATISFSNVVSSYECVQWLPFHLVPNWEDDLYCIRMDEDRWREARSKGQSISDLADALRTEASRGCVA